MKKEKDRQLDAEIYWSAAMRVLIDSDKDSVNGSYGCCDAIRTLATNAREKVYASVRPLRTLDDDENERMLEISTKKAELIALFNRVYNPELIALFNRVYNPRYTPECSREAHGAYWMEDYGEYDEEGLRNRRALAMCFMATLCLTGDADDISQSGRD